MPLDNVSPHIQEMVLWLTHSAGGTSTGVSGVLAVPYRGTIREVGFTPQSLVASAVTMAVAISDNSPSSTASAFTNFVTSTVGTFSSVNLQEGRVASVGNLSQACKAGDTLRYTFSGGNAAAIAFSVYAILRRG